MHKRAPGRQLPGILADRIREKKGEKMAKQHTFTSFDSPDKCQLCGGYDTIQAYIPTEHGGKKYIFHVCEECGSRPETEKELIKKFFRDTCQGEN